ncbi:MAG: type II toxin-antitoxin system VapC family toxin [Bacteroidales bacterium]|jgi:PIN domain nuclease of toxin-antitoxin system|nr:type II toxin-antitoxin system VapC family toxin [Bacteroidales bacterium]
MIFLLDTHTFIWSLLKTINLGKNAKEIIYSRKNKICVSAVSFWEISIKTKLDKFLFQNIDINKFPQYARDMGFNIIDMQETESISFHELPLKADHKDPFDRMLIWQAITKNMTLISKDEKFEQYKQNGLKLVW